jgi:hypothetical protein
LAGIIADLLLVGDYHDVALRDFGLFVAALALSRLAVADGGRAHGRPALTAAKAIPPKNHETHTTSDRRR